MPSNRRFNLIICTVCFVIAFVLTLIIVFSTVDTNRNTKDNLYPITSSRIEAPIDYDKYVLQENEKHYRHSIIKNTELLLFDEQLVETDILSLTASAPEVNISDLLADQLNIDYTISEIQYTVTDEDIKNIATIIQLEVIGAGSNMYQFDDPALKYWEMSSVAQVIKNRMTSSKFPNTVSGVIFDSHKSNGKTIYQFSPAPTLYYYTPTEEALTAAREVFNDNVQVLPDNYLFFCASSIETRFEKGNRYCLVTDDYGNYIKTKGHLTTFYAGNP